MNGGHRWALWLPDAKPHELAKLPKVRERIEAVKRFREESKKQQTRDWAKRPSEFVENRHSVGRYVLVPRVISERREYSPCGYIDNDVVNDSVFMLPEATLFTFGLISRAAHMAWMRAVSGRLESRYRYSSDLVYNTFPWPDREQLKPKQVQAVEAAAQAVLDARELYPDSTLAELYDPLLMPRELRAAHTALDKAVDALYGLKAGATEAERLARLLELYQELVPMLAGSGTKKKGRRRKM